MVSIDDCSFKDSWSTAISFLNLKQPKKRFIWTTRMKHKRDSLSKNMKNLPVRKHTGFLDEIIDWLERNW